MERDLKAALDARREAGLYRQPRTLERLGGPEVLADGHRLLVFCSNDYLGLAEDPRLTAAFTASAGASGVGSGAAHLVSGHTVEHQALEAALAKHLGRERALLFSTGYMANLGVIDALAGRGDPVYQDRLNHASLLDGARLAGARLIRYRHGESADLVRRMEQRDEPGGLVATDGVFSMDGDVAPLSELAAVARRHGAWLMVDDAHGLGVLGACGCGSVAEAGLSQADVPILMGTLGKGLGTFGAFVAGSTELIDTLIQRARTYVYTTAMPPALAAATQRALEIAAAEQWRRDHLQRLIERLRSEVRSMGLELMPSRTPIQPVVMGSAERAEQASQWLGQKGILVTAIRPPTVPEGTARLRITLSAAHTDAHLDRLLEALRGLAPAGTV